MSRRRFSAAAAVLGLAPAALALPTAGEGNRIYRFSPVNQYGLELTARYWNPIVDHVASRSGVPLQLKIGRTSADTTAFVIADEVDFVFSNHLFSPERDRLGWRVWGRRRTPPIHSEIVVLADSPVTRLEQLAELPVAFPGPEALVAYKFAYAELLNRGVAVQVVFAGNMDGAFAQLVSGRAKAVGANSQLMEGWSRRENKRLRTLWQSGPLHDLALMASRKVPEPELRAVSAAFIGMSDDPTGRALLATAAELVKLPPDTNFVASTGAEYDVYRNFHRTAPAAVR